MDESLTPKIIRIATRKSPLALWQAQMVGQQIKKIDETIEIELVKITTSGDKILDKPLYDIGGKSLFLKELEDFSLELKSFEFFLNINDFFFSFFFCFNLGT